MFLLTFVTVYVYDLGVRVRGKTPKLAANDANELWVAFARGLLCG